MRHRRIVLIASLLACGLTLSGCESFDPTEWFNTKKPLPGDRKAVFPEGVPGVPQGVPPELVQGYQPPPEPVPEPPGWSKPSRSRSQSRNRRPKTAAAAPPPAAKRTAASSRRPAQSQSAFPDPPRR